MAFFIKPFPGQTYGGRYAGNDDIRAYVGLGDLVERKLHRNDEPYVGLVAYRMPLDFEARATVPLTDDRTTDLIVLKKTTNRRRHRCFARCPDCQKFVPAGRTHQHKC